MSLSSALVIPKSQPVTIMGINSPALEWLLHNREVEIVDELNPSGCAADRDHSSHAGSRVYPLPIVGRILPGDSNPFGMESLLLTGSAGWYSANCLEITKPSFFAVRDDLFPDARATSQQP